MSTYSVDVSRKVWNNIGGESTEVKPDGDALGLVEVISREDTGKIVAQHCFAPAEARLVAQAMIDTANELEASKEST